MPKKNSFANDLIEAPWWVSLILAGVAYLISGILPGISSPNLGITIVVSAAKAFAPIAIFFFLVMALLSFITQFKKHGGSTTRRSTPYRQTNPTNDLILARWWVILSLAGVAYLSGHFLPAPSTSHMGMAVVLSMAKGIATPASIFLIIIAIVSFIRGFKVRSQLKGQRSVDSLNELSWKSFEDVTGELFRQRGYRVEEMLGGGADGGVDLRLRKDGQLTLVQCKRWKKRKVRLPIVRELLGAMTAESADKGMLVTTSTFTSEAITFAQKQGIQLINGDQLIKEINNLHSSDSSKRAPSSPPKSSPPALPTSIQPTDSPPACPKCAQTMALRTAKRGPNSGNQFWGCQTYPKCRGTRDL